MRKVARHDDALAVTTSWAFSPIYPPPRRRDEETIEGLSFEAFRRVATMIKVPAEGSRGLTTEMVSIGSVDLADAQCIDASTHHV